MKKNDHLMDASRYLVRTGRDLARCKPADKQADNSYRLAGGWAERARGSSRRASAIVAEGLAMPRNIRAKVLELRSVFVPESKRKAGLGNALMRKICADADIAGHALF